jgi:hypothetical protein
VVHFLAEALNRLKDFGKYGTINRLAAIISGKKP